MALMSMFRLKSCHKNWRASINFQAVTPAPRSVRVIDNKYQISTPWSVLYVNNTTQWHFSAFFAGNIDNVLFIPLYTKTQNTKLQNKTKQNAFIIWYTNRIFKVFIKYDRVQSYFPVPRSPCWLSTGLAAAINAIIFTKKKIICQQLILILGWWRERQKYLEDINVVTYHHHRVVTVRTQPACTGSKDTVNIATLYYLFCSFFFRSLLAQFVFSIYIKSGQFPMNISSQPDFFKCWRVYNFNVEVCLHMLS